MSSLFAIANQKGGVGKTTTCVNLAAALAATRKRVLMIDLDPQGNATMGSGIDKYELTLSTYDMLVHQRPVAEVRCFSEAGAYDVLPTNSDLTAAEVELLNTAHKEKRLSEALAPVRDEYDFILIDCPPSLNMLTLNGLVAADSVLIPMQCEYFALEGLSALLDTIARVAATVNPGLHVEGLLRTMYDPRNSLTNEVSAQLSEHFGEQLYRTVIPRNVRLAEAPSFGQPVIQYDPKSRGAQAYLALAGEVIRRRDGAATGSSVADGTGLPSADALQSSEH